MNRDQANFAGLLEDATRWRAFDATVAETKARNVSVPKEEIDAAIKEALANVRAERFGRRYR